MSTDTRGIGSKVLILTSESSNQEGIVRFRYPIREVCRGYNGCNLIQGPIGKNVVGESGLNRLVNVEYVNLVVP